MASTCPNRQNGSMRDTRAGRVSYPVPVTCTTVPPCRDPLLGYTATTVRAASYSMSTEEAAKSAPLLDMATIAPPGRTAGRTAGGLMH